MVVVFVALPMFSRPSAVSRACTCFSPRCEKGTGRACVSKKVHRSSATVFRLQAFCCCRGTPTCLTVQIFCAHTSPSSVSAPNFRIAGKKKKNNVFHQASVSNSAQGGRRLGASGGATGLDVGYYRPPQRGDEQSGSAWENSRLPKQQQHEEDRQGLRRGTTGSRSPSGGGGDGGARSGSSPVPSACPREPRPSVGGPAASPVDEREPELSSRLPSADSKRRVSGDGGAGKNGGEEGAEGQDRRRLNSSPEVRDINGGLPPAAVKELLVLDVRWFCSASLDLAA